MGLITQIKQDQLAARKLKASVIVNLLTTLIGEAEMVSKNAGTSAPSDEEVLAVIKKFLKGVNETLKLTTDLDKISILEQEAKMLSKYLPAELTAEQLKEIIGAQIVLNPGIKQSGLMAFLKVAYGSAVNGKVASTIVKELLDGSRI